MIGNWKNGLGLLVIVALVGLVLALSSDRSAAQKDGSGGRYKVVATDGTHLVVTDNQANKVFFYAIDQGGKPGDDLKLRGTINLEDVGKPAIKPTTIK